MSTLKNKRLAIIQSSYIPWKGYFDIINSVDEFLLYDNVQFTRSDWRSRNKIKTAAGLQWLTIPIKHKYPQRLCDAEISDSHWRAKHWKSIVQNYSKAAHFHDYKEVFENLYMNSREQLLSRSNWSFISAICDILEIATPIRWTMEIDVYGDPNERLVSYCQEAGATTYVSGPSARSYIDEARFVAAGIRVEYFEYEGYPIYRQLHGEFAHQVSIIDLILNEGPNSRKYMKTLASEAGFQ